MQVHAWALLIAVLEHYTCLHMRCCWPLGCSSTPHQRLCGVGCGSVSTCEFDQTSSKNDNSSWSKTCLTAAGCSTTAPASAPIAARIQELGIYEYTITNCASAPANFPAVVPLILAAFGKVAAALCSPASSISNPSSSSSRSSGALRPARSAANAVLLAVILCCLVVLADAMAAAAGAAGSTAIVLFARCVMAKPEFYGEAGGSAVSLQGSRSDYSTAGQWKMWQLCFLAVVHTLHSNGAFPSTRTAAAHAHEGSSITTSSVTGSSTDTTTSRSSSKWGYLLHLQSSKQWLAAVTRFASKWCEIKAAVSTADAAHIDPLAAAEAAAGSPGTAGRSMQSSSQQPKPDAEQISTLCSDAVELCRTLLAAGPVPLVCNSPACQNLSGVSETAAAVRMYAGCHCRYCSAACQAADWKRHKKACRRMAAAGEVCP